jgi:hypothetical protein
MNIVEFLVMLAFTCMPNKNGGLLGRATASNLHRSALFRLILRQTGLPYQVMPLNALESGAVHSPPLCSLVDFFGPGDHFHNCRSPGVCVKPSDLADFRE